MSSTTFSFVAGSQPGVIGGITGIDLFGDLQVQYRLGVRGTTGLVGLVASFSGAVRAAHARFLVFPAALAT